MDLIDDTFLKSISSKIEETSSIVQLQEIFIKNKNHCYNGRLSKIFYSRIDHFESKAVDSLTISQCERLREDLDAQLDFVSVENKSKNENILNFYMQFQTREGRILEDCVRELFKMIIKKTSGRRLEACRVLGISEQEFKDYNDNSKDIKSFTRNYKKQVRSAKAKDVRGNVD